jgi:hypothetical protein
MSTKYDFHEIKEKKLTPDKLRRYKGFENINDEEAINIIETLYQLSLLTFTIYNNNRRQKI